MNSIKTLTARSFKANRKRNFFVFAAIFITTFMIASTLSVGLSLTETITLHGLQIKGSAAHAQVLNISTEDIDKIKNLDFVSSVGVYSKAADVVFDEEMYVLSYFDETLWKRHLLPAYMDIEGEYPEKENEVMLSLRFLHFMEITEPKIGMEIAIRYRTADGAEHDGLFILSGFYNAYESGWHEPIALPVSQVFLDKLGDNAASKLNASVILKSGTDKVYLTIGKIHDALRPNFYTIITPNRYNDGTSGVLIAIFIAAILFLIVTGFLLIYNVLYISVSNDVRFYGLLKTVGVTSKQIRRIVIGQALRLCIIAIPAGTVLAGLASFAVVPTALSVFGAEMTIKVSLSPYIFTGAPLLTLLTTLIGSAAPSRKASRISPIEAVRYSGQDINKKRALLPTKGKPFLMAVRNIFSRNKKRMISVFLSLFFSLTLFMTAAVLVFSMDAEQYILGIFDKENFLLRYWPSSSYEPLVSTWSGNQIFLAPNADGYDSWDFESEDMDWDAYWKWFNEAKQLFENQRGDDEETVDYGLGFPLSFNEPTHKFDEQYLKRLENLPGFISYRAATRAGGLMIYTPEFEPYARADLNAVNYIGMDDVQQYIEDQLREEVMKRNFICYVYGVDVSEIDAIKHTFYPPIDIESFERGEIALFSGFRNTELLEGIENAEIILSGGKFNFKVAGIVTRMFGDMRPYWTAPAVIVAKEFLEANAKTFIYSVGVRTNDKDEALALTEIQALTEHDPEVLLGARLSERDTVRSMQMFFGIIGGSIAGVIGLTGLLNFVNVMSIGIFSRKRELAAMESIGMTRRQTRRMLIYEGAGYAFVTLLLAGTLGNLAALSLYRFIENSDNTGIFNFNYPYIPFILTALVILSVCLITPLIAYRSVNKATIVERLREIE